MNFLSKKVCYVSYTRRCYFVREKAHKYVDLDINDEELHSNGIGDRISIQKVD